MQPLTKRQREEFEAYWKQNPCQTGSHYAAWFAVRFRLKVQVSDPPKDGQGSVVFPRLGMAAPIDDTPGPPPIEPMQTRSSSKRILEASYIEASNGGISTRSAKKAKTGSSTPVSPVAPRKTPTAGSNKASVKKAIPAARTRSIPATAGAEAAVLTRAATAAPHTQRPITATGSSPLTTRAAAAAAAAAINVASSSSKTPASNPSTSGESAQAPTMKVKGNFATAAAAAVAPLPTTRAPTDGQGSTAQFCARPFGVSASRLPATAPDAGAHNVPSKVHDPEPPGSHANIKSQKGIQPIEPTTVFTPTATASKGDETAGTDSVNGALLTPATDIPPVIDGSKNGSLFPPRADAPSSFPSKISQHSILDPASQEMLRSFQERYRELSEKTSSSLPRFIHLDAQRQEAKQEKLRAYHEERRKKKASFIEQVEKEDKENRRKLEQQEVEWKAKINQQFEDFGRDIVLWCGEKLGKSQEALEKMEAAREKERKQWAKERSELKAAAQSEHVDRLKRRVEDLESQLNKQKAEADELREILEEEMTFRKEERKMLDLSEKRLRRISEVKPV
ncbi:hypothetical protein FN846DRAFT_886319 [Sphaerosporella brunnea]|uniref:Uncharacterized protein n=1 Tax=Sphaerosporella brunnea TaxID=1250544 RepID=A0A5J5F965_9PEZI|nr:hypothetical protein FN846DRAFT_886319 [Sphaerosporella brunnea]